MTVIGWDIGGVNTKVARVAGGQVHAVVARFFEVQWAPDALVQVLRELTAEVGAPAGALHAVTMTAELSQVFRTKREGVGFVLDAVDVAVPPSAVRVFTVDGRFLSSDAARADPHAVAAANWAATARLVARLHPNALLIDIGTTTTDIIPIAGGAVVAQGRTDPERLASGELIYTGAVRTPIEAMASHVPFGGGLAGVSAEGFALAGDVHVWRGDLAASDYAVTPPDRRPATREFAGERLARAICADREMVDEAGVSRIADALAEAQIARIGESVRRVCAREPSLRTAVVAGVGAFIAARAARTAGLEVIPLGVALGEDAARCAPAAAVAWLLEAGLTDSGAEREGSHTRGHRASARTEPGEPPARSHPFERARVDLVVKVGGGLMAHPDSLASVLAVVAEAAAERRVLLVPGGGFFADAVREADRTLGLSDDAAHWMAVLAMDQFAHLLADRLVSATVITSGRDITAAIASRRLPVLAPSRWLHEVDPLPHSWDVTSDSISAWVAGELHASALVLVKPPGARGDALVDAHFARALRPGVTVTTVPGDRIDALRGALVGGP